MGTKSKKTANVERGDGEEVRKYNFLEKTCDFSERFEKTDPEYSPEHIDKAIEFMEEETRETKEAYDGVGNDEGSGPSNPSKEAEDTLDGFLDTAFVALAGAYKFLRLHGHSPAEAVKRVDQAMNRVCDANLSKEHPELGIVRNERGKVQKPEGWKEPRFADLLKKEPDRKVGADRNDEEAA